MQNPRSAALARLDALVGEWEMEATVGGRSMGSSRTTLRWADEGAFLLQRADVVAVGDDVPPGWVTNLPFPLWGVVGLDDHSGRFTMLYSDSRGVSRVYSMTLEDGLWRMWGRPGPEFFQRFTGNFSDDGAVITARWESSKQGTEWVLDFDLIYTRMR